MLYAFSTRNENSKSALCLYNVNTMKQPFAFPQEGTVNRLHAFTHEETVNRPYAFTQEETLNRPYAFTQEKTVNRPYAFTQEETVNRPYAFTQEETVNRPYAFTQQKKQVLRPCAFTINQLCAFFTNTSGLLLIIESRRMLDYANRRKA